MSLISVATTTPAPATNNVGIKGRGGRRTLLHVFPSFGIGGVPLRMLRVINHFGGSVAHVIVALDDNVAAAAQFSPEIDVTLLPAPPRNRGMVRGAIAAASLLRQIRPDLLVTYNWGAIEWAIANHALGLADHIHLEAGFGKEEADKQIARRVWCRRLALSRCRSVVVPSRRLEDLAHSVWKLPARRVIYLPNGVDIGRFADTARDQVAGFSRRPGELVIGTVAPLRAEKNIARLLRVFALLRSDVPTRLIIAGDGTERTALECLSRELGIAARVLFTGQVRPETVLGTFDVFALSSDTEQMPNSLLEAMAAGCAVAAVDVGDVKGIVSAENREYIVPRDEHAAFAAAIERLLRDTAARDRLGRKNRERAIAEFSQERMFAGYSEVLGMASGAITHRPAAIA